MSATEYTARFTTGGRINTVEEWLKQNIHGTWSFKLENISDDMSKKSYVVRFEDERDLAAFKQHFSLPRRPEQFRTPTLSKRVAGTALAFLGSIAALPVKAWVALGRPFYRGDVPTDDLQTLSAGQADPHRT